MTLCTVCLSCLLMHLHFSLNTRPVITSMQSYENAGWLNTPLYLSVSVSVSPLLYTLFFPQKELVLRAVQKDQAGERAAALSLYCSALEHFVPAIHCKNSTFTL